MGFWKRLYRTIVCLVVGWLSITLILVAVVHASGVSIRYALAWSYETARVALICWALFGIPLALFDKRRSWLAAWWVAAACGGILGAVSLAAYLLLFYFVPDLSVRMGGLYAVAFGIGSATVGLYYSNLGAFRPPPLLFGRLGPHRQH